MTVELDPIRNAGLPGRLLDAALPGLLRWRRCSRAK
jgi:hypothetical protein